MATEGDSSRRPLTMKVRSEPRISAPKLGDYMATPSATTRFGLLRDQKIAPDVQIARYRKAAAEIRTSLVMQADPVTHLTKASARLKSATGKTPWQTNDNATSSEALDHFAKFLGKFNRKGLMFAETRTTGYKIPIEGVEVSVYPLLRIARDNKDGTRSTGALLAVIRKGDGLSDRAGAVTAELVRMALTRAGDKSVDPKLCIVVDVFRGKMFQASKQYRKMQADIAAACREIAIIWPKIEAKPAETKVGTPVVRDIPLLSPEVPQIPRSAS